MILNQKVPNLTNNSWRRNAKLPTKSAWNAMAEVFSDDLNLNIGDLILHHLYHATRKPSARLFMLMRLIQAHASECLRARPFTPARPLHERTRSCKRSFLTP